MTPSLIDIHCHLDFSQYDKDREDVINRALAENIMMITVGTDKESSRRAVDISAEYDGIFSAISVHPYGAEESFDIPFFKELAKSPKMVAIGECGLDYSKIDVNDLYIKNLQQNIFMKQIELSLEVDKPIVIHCRDAHKDVLDILKANYGNLSSRLNGNIHFYSGSWEQAQEYMNLGFYFSFTGAITFGDNYKQVIENLPLEKIMVETDAPFVAPEKFRGKRCEPLHVKEVAQKIAEIKKISYEEVAAATTKNAIKLFRLPVSL